MSEGFYQPLRPGLFSKVSFESSFIMALKTRNWELFTLTYLSIHAHPQNNEVKFSSSIANRISELTGVKPLTIKRALKTLVDLKFIKNLTPRKPHYLINAEVMNKQKYLPYGFQQGLKVEQNSVVELILRERPVFNLTETEKLLDKVEDLQIELAQKDLDIEALEKSKEELGMWHDEQVEGIREDLRSFKAEIMEMLGDRLSDKEKEEIKERHLKLVPSPEIS